MVKKFWTFNRVIAVAWVFIIGVGVANYLGYKPFAQRSGIVTRKGDEAEKFRRFVDFFVNNGKVPFSQTEQDVGVMGLLWEYMVSGNDENVLNAYHDAMLGLYPTSGDLPSASLNDFVHWFSENPNTRLVHVYEAGPLEYLLVDALDDDVFLRQCYDKLANGQADDLEYRALRELLISKLERLGPNMESTYQGNVPDALPDAEKVYPVRDYGEDEILGLLELIRSDPHNVDQVKKENLGMMLDAVLMATVDFITPANGFLLGERMYAYRGSIVFGNKRMLRGDVAYPQLSSIVPVLSVGYDKDSPEIEMFLWYKGINEMVRSKNHK